MPNCLRQYCVAALLAFTMAGGSLISPAHADAAKPAPAANAAGVIVVPSGYGMIETVERLKKDIGAKGSSISARSIKVRSPPLLACPASSHRSC